MTPRPLYLGPLFVAAILAAIVLVYWPTFYLLTDLAIADTEGYSHRAAVLPLFLVLLWNQRDELAALPVRPNWWGVVGLIGAGLVWLVGELVFARVLTNFAVLAMVPTAVLTVLGVRWLAAIAYPCAFLLFAVPAEGPLVPTLVNWTAAATVASIQASGVPIYREGAYLMIPSGNWAVADTCSGINFLITCLMLAVLYAWSMFQSTSKRIAFIFGALVIGIVGNWIRAYLTIMIAHLSDNRYLRDGHELFGWILFAIFMVIYYRLCWPYRDASIEGNSPGRDSSMTGQSAAQAASRFQITAAAAAVLASLMPWPLMVTALSRDQNTQAPDIADIAPQQGWSRAGNRSVEWAPELKNPTRERVQSFIKNGIEVEVFTATFQRETWESKLVSSVNQLVASDNTIWSLVERGVTQTEISGKSVNAKTGIVLGREERILAWQWYWVDGIFIGSDTRAKLAQLVARIQQRGDGSAWVAIYTKANESPGAGARVLTEFTRDMGESLERHLIIMSAKP